MILSDVVAQFAIGTGTGATTGTIVVPEWADRVLAIRPVCAHAYPTDATGVDWSWKLSSNELIGFTPVIALGPWGPSADATNSSCNMPPMETFPLNIPAHGGETITYSNVVESAVAANGYGSATFWFGNAGDVMPSYVDPLPGVQRFGAIGTFTASGAAGAKATGTAYTIVGARAIVEANGCLSEDAIAEKDPCDGMFELSSHGFASSPIKFAAHPIAATLGTTTMLAGGPVPMTRVPLMMPVDRYCVIQDYFKANAASVNTDDWQTGVWFVR